MLSLYNPFYLYPEYSLDKKSFRKDQKSFFDWGVEYKKIEDNALAVSVDLPGIEEKDIQVEVTADNILQIKGERKTATSSHSVNKSFSLPESYDADHITAELKNGVLTLILPSKQVTKNSKKIEVKSSK